MAVSEEGITQNSVVLECELACFSPGLVCVLSNIATKSMGVTCTLPTTVTSNFTGSFTSYNYRTQLITLTKLTSGTTYNYCVVGINVTTMMEVGDPVCGNFSTDATNEMDTATDGMLMQIFTMCFIQPLLSDTFCLFCLCPLPS